MKKIKSTINCKLIEESQNEQYKKYSVFDDLQDVSKQNSSFYGSRFSILMTSQLQNQQKCLKCCNSENNDNIKNPLSGIMSNVLKFPSIDLAERIE